MVTEMNIALQSGAADAGRDGRHWKVLVIDGNKEEAQKTEDLWESLGNWTTVLAYRMTESC